MERNISTFEADVIMDSYGVYPSGCTKNITCSAVVIGEERIATDFAENDCGVLANAGDVLPIDGSAIPNVLTVKMYDPNTQSQIWVSKTSFDSNHEQCNGCCIPLSQLATPVLTAEAGDTLVDLSWPAVTNATNYVLEQDTDFSFGSPTEIYNGALLLYSNTGLTNGVQYYYRLRAQATGYTDSEYGYATATPAP